MRDLIGVRSDQRRLKGAVAEDAICTGVSPNGLGEDLEATPARRRRRRRAGLRRSGIPDLRPCFNPHKHFRAIRSARITAVSIYSALAEDGKYRLHEIDIRYGGVVCRLHRICSKSWRNEICMAIHAIHARIGPNCSRIRLNACGGPRHLRRRLAPRRGALVLGLRPVRRGDFLQSASREREQKNQMHLHYSHMHYYGFAFTHAG
jgi:hypothetical protein